MAKRIFLETKKQQAAAKDDSQGCSRQKKF
jgi:hypothetical protein